jgi:hypothetical protein
MAQKDSMSEMTVPFRDRAEYEDFGLAGYLRFVEEPDSKGIRGALFCVNSRGEPIDFSFTRIDVGASFLWRLGDARRHAVTALCKALFAACPKEPALLLSLAEEVSPRVFTEDIEVGAPLMSRRRSWGHSLNKRIIRNPCRNAASILGRRGASRRISSAATA